jgi:hypothetical protein
VTATAASASHGATINIENNCGHDMTFGMEKTCHGKYTSEPPYSIPNGATGTFRVSPRSGSSIGPKGWVRYNIAVNDKIEVFQLFWDHPVGSGDSRYECTYQPYGIDENTENSGGHEQTVTIKLHNILEEKKTTLTTLTCSH